jgi:Putative prokaryotic signal transducing protein
VNAQFATFEWEGCIHPTGRFFRRMAGFNAVKSLCHGFGTIRFRIGDVMVEAGNLAANAQARPDPNEKLVKVFESEQEPEALVVKGLLDSAGIESDLTSASLVQDAFPGLGGMILLVREEDAEEARRVIAEGRQSSPSDDDTAEISTVGSTADSTIEESPQKASTSGRRDKK